MRFDNEMEMIPHDAEVIDRKSVFFPRTGYDIDEQFLHFVRIHDHLPIIRPGGDMIAGSIHENSWLVHTRNSQRKGIMLQEASSVRNRI
jgi:hypothetical protein